MKSVGRRSSGGPSKAVARSRSRGHQSAPPSRREGHERQAELAGTGFQRGDTGLQRRLTSARPAAVSLPGSRAERLPMSLLGELQTSFGADLSSVRLHRDTTAAAQAQDLRAQAFAAGTHIYFGAGRFRPDTGGGRALIGHEVAHVLQQTARPSLGSQALKAVPSDGEGPVQCAPDFAEMRKGHRTAKKETGKYKWVAEELAKIKADKAAIAAFATRELPYIATWPEEAESLLYDVLKRSGNYDLAAQLIERDNFEGGKRIQTLYWSGNTKNKLDERSTGIYVFRRAIREDPALKLYYSEFLRLIEMFLFQPLSHKTPPLLRELDQGKSKKPKYQSIQAHYEGLREDYTDHGKRSENEWFYQGFARIKLLDDDRIEECDDARIKARKTSDNDVLQRIALPRYIRGWGERIATSSFGDSDEDKALTQKWRPFFEAVSEDVIKRADKVDAVWAGYRALNKGMTAYYDAWWAADDKSKVAVPPEIAAIRTRATQLASRTGLATLLVEMMAELNAPAKDGSRVPDKDNEYSKRCAKHADLLQKRLRSHYDKPMLGLFRGGKTEELTAVLWTAAYVQRVIRYLRWDLAPFSRPPSTGAGATATLVVIDKAHIVAHRIAVARRLRRLGVLLGFKTMLQGAEAVLEAKLESESVLVFLPDSDGKLWREDEVGPGKIQEDFSNFPFKGSTALTPYHLVLLYHVEYLDTLEKALNARLPGGLGHGGGVLSGAAGDARKAMENSGRKPQRWQSERAFFAQKAKGKDFAKMLWEHLDGQAFVKEAENKGLSRYIPVQTMSRPFVWFWPPYAKITAWLREAVVLNVLVAEKQFGATDAEALEKVRETISDDDWWSILQGILDIKLGRAKGTPFTDEERKAFMDKVDSFFVKKKRETRERLGPLFHQALRIDRRSFARMVHSDLRDYAKDHRLGDALESAKRVGTYYGLARSAFPAEMGAGAEGSVEAMAQPKPFSDSRLHLAVLLLAVSKDLDTAFEYVRYGKLVNAYLGLFEDGLASARVLKAMPASSRKEYLLKSENKDDWIEKRLTHLEAVTKRFQKHRDQVQSRKGFVALAGDNALDVYLRYSSPLPAGTLLLPRTGRGILGSELTGKRYRFVAVLHPTDFIYHPPFGDQRSIGLPGSPSGYSEAEFLDMDGNALKTGAKLLRFQEEDANGDPIGKPRDLGWETEEDQDLFLQIYSGAVYAAFGSAMANVEKAIETYVDTALELAELIPGWGQVITGARVVAVISEFWTSDEYKNLLRVLDGDLSEIMQGLEQKLEEHANPQALLHLLLFGNEKLDLVLTGATAITTKSDAKEARGPADKRGKFGALRKAFSAIKALGKALFKALYRLKDKVQEPARDARTYVSSRPVLSFAFSFAATHLYEVVALATKSAAILAMFDTQDEKAAAKAGVNLKDLLRRTLGAEQKDLGTQMQRLTQSLEQLELPAQIIDLKPAVGTVLYTLETFVGKRLGVKGKVVTMILDKSGALDYFNDYISETIIEKGFDPNDYWRETVIPQISGHFDDTKDALIGSLNSVLASPAFDGMFTPMPKGPPLALAPNQAETYPEMETGAAQPLARRGKELIPRPEQVPASGAGQPLGEILRSQLEASFGQDFAHVRLHTGADGEAMSRAFGAAALTAGSHVFMGSGLNPGGGEGRNVLHHELAHVVQQSGPRPLGKASSPRPLSPRFELGLNLDPAREEDAHAIARQLRPGSGGKLSLTSGSVAAGAVQPYKLEDLNPYTLARILRDFNDLPAIKKSQRKIDDSTANPTLDRTRDTDARDALLKALNDVRKKSSPLTVEAPNVFKPVLGRILKKLDEVGDDTFKAAVEQIAKKAQDPIPQPKGSLKTKKAKKTKQEHYLDPDPLARQLEGYILGKTGVALSLTLQTEDFTAPNGKKLEQLHQTQPLKGVKILHLHLPYMAPNAKLSILAITNTWPKAKSDDKLRAKLSSLVRTHMEGYGIRATVWALFGTTYRLGFFFKREIDKLLAQKIVGTLDPDMLPPPDIYGQWNPSIAPNPIGVRLATYDHDASQKATGRHSHHLTQYLIADYFANKNDGKKPFKKGRLYPGVTWGVGGVTHIAPVATGTAGAIQVGDTRGSSGRGGKMPAISLSASTHLSGDLHITPGADDLGGSTKKTQAHAVDSTFRTKLPTALRANAGRSEYKEYVEKTGRDKTAQKIHGAVTATYRHWSRHMTTQLKANMPRMELQYYKTLAADSANAAVNLVAIDANAQEDLLEDLTAAANESETHNADVLFALGWPKP